MTLYWWVSAMTCGYRTNSTQSSLWATVTTDVSVVSSQLEHMNHNNILIVKTVVGRGEKGLYGNSTFGQFFLPCKFNNCMKKIDQQQKRYSQHRLNELKSHSIIFTEETFGSKSLFNLF